MSVEPGFGGQSFHPPGQGAHGPLAGDSGELSIPRRDRRRDQRRHHRTGRRGAGVDCSSPARPVYGAADPGTGVATLREQAAGALADGHRGRRVGVPKSVDPIPRRGDGARHRRIGCRDGLIVTEPAGRGRGHRSARRGDRGRAHNRSAARTRRWWRSRRRGRRRAARRSSSRWSPVTHGANRSVFASPDRCGRARVVYALADPNPLAAGGAQALRDAGIAVVAGFGSEIAADGPLRAWLHRQRTGRPLVIAKIATTLDGRVAAPDGTSQWITGAQARADAHVVRGVWTPSSSAPAPFWPMTRRSPRTADGSLGAHQPVRIVLGNRDLPPGQESSTTPRRRDRSAHTTRMTFRRGPRCAGRSSSKAGRR